MVIQIQVPDRCVTYEELLDDFALRLAPLLRTDNREVISQREAYRIFGEGNVRRWFSKGMLTVRKRPGKVEYLMSELRLCQSRQQDYLE